MIPAFTGAIRYFVQVVCLSPLRTGGTDQDPRQILRDGDGRPILQGTSLAGALRSWREDAALFGTIEKGSSLIVSDIVFADNQMAARPRLAIDGGTGTARQKVKFDMVALPTGTAGAFQLTWQGSEDPDTAVPKIEAYLSALHLGRIHLGAMTSNGFGRVSLTVRRRIYRMNRAADLDAWLLGDDVTDAEEIELADLPDHDAVFRVKARIDGVLVKAATHKQQKGSGKSRSVWFRTENIRENGLALIPASSLKGAIRSQIRRISPCFGRSCREQDNLFGRQSGRETPGIAGVVRFSDGALCHVRPAENRRIRINPLTGGMAGGRLFVDAPLDAELLFEIRLPAGRQAGAALLLYALRDLGLGLYELGSGSAVGRGRVRALEVEIRTAAGSARMTCGDRQVTLSDPGQIVRQWQDALRGGEAL